MVAATLVLLCTRPLDGGVFGQAPWLLTIPAIAIIGREVSHSVMHCLKGFVQRGEPCKSPAHYHQIHALHRIS